jgi:hypothetical protein
VTRGGVGSADGSVPATSGGCCFEMSNRSSSAGGVGSRALRLADGRAGGAARRIARLHMQSVRTARELTCGWVARKLDWRARDVAMESSLSSAVNGEWDCLTGSGESLASRGRAASRAKLACEDTSSSQSNSVAHRGVRRRRQPEAGSAGRPQGASGRSRRTGHGSLAPASTAGVPAPPVPSVPHVRPAADNRASCPCWSKLRCRRECPTRSRSSRS